MAVLVGCLLERDTEMGATGAGAPREVWRCANRECVIKSATTKTGIGTTGGPVIGLRSVHTMMKIDALKCVDVIRVRWSAVITLVVFMISDSYRVDYDVFIDRFWLV